MNETNETDNQIMAVKNDKIRIKLIIADRTYPFVIKPEHEEIYRLSAKKIKEKVLKIKEKVNASKDAQDILAIATLQFVVELINEQEQNKVQPIHDELLQNVNADLEDYLQLHESK